MIRVFDIFKKYLGIPGTPVSFRACVSLVVVIVPEPPLFTYHLSDVNLDPVKLVPLCHILNDPFINSFVTPPPKPVAVLPVASSISLLIVILDPALCSLIEFVSIPFCASI